MAYKVMVAFTKNANEYDKDKQLECFEECGEQLILKEKIMVYNLL